MIFSFSRWLKDNKNMETIQTHDIIPLDLNCILCAVEFSLAFLFEAINQTIESKKFHQIAENRLTNINEFFWNNSSNLWCDYNISNKSLESKYYASIFFIFWLNGFCSLPDFISEHRQNEAFEKIKELGVFDYYGLPTSLINSGQQWDFPNVWPPLQHVAVEGLMNSRNPQHREMGERLAKRFIKNCYLLWKDTGYMYEKYDVIQQGKPGEGGEYDVQYGFGWTNGVVIDILHKFGDHWRCLR